MKLSIKYNLIGKAKLVFERGATLHAGEIRPAQITYGFQAVDWQPEQVIQHITAGKPFAVGQYENGHRKRENFLISGIIALDIDQGASGNPLTEAEYTAFLASPFITKNAFAVIQSASSRPNAYKLRVLFQLSEPITDAKEYGELVAFVMKLAGNLPDRACKDAARFFFGGQAGRPADFVAVDNILDVASLRQELARRVTPPKPRHIYQNTSIDKYDLAQSALSYIPDEQLDYADWLAVLMGLNSEFGLNGVALAEGWTTDDQMGLEARFKSFGTGSGITLGTLFHLAQQYGFQFSRQNHNKTLTFKDDHFDHLPERYRETKLNQRFLTERPFELLSPVILLKSPIGTGKTEWLIAHIQAGQSVLVVLHRRSLVGNSTQRLNAAGLGFHSYDDLHPDQLRDHCPERLVICSNSLHKLMNENGQLPQFDLVIMDEVEQGLHHLTGETFKRGEGAEAVALLTRLLQNASEVILADAHLGELTLKWIKTVRPELPHLIQNDYRMTRGKMTLLGSPEQVLERALNALQQASKPIALVCDTKRQAKTVYQFLTYRGFQGRMVTGDNSDFAETAAFLADINHQLNQLDFFVYNSAIGTGVDIQAEVEEVYGIFENTVITAEEQHQALGRCRRATRFWVYSAQVHRTRPTDWETLKADSLSNLRAYRQKFGVGYQLDRHGNLQLLPQQEAFLDLHCQVQAQRNQFFCLPRFTFLQLAQEYTLTFEDKPEDDHPLRAELADLRQQLRQADKDAVLTATPIDEDTYQRLKETKRSTAEAEAGYKRFTIESFYKQPVSEQLYEYTLQRGMAKTSFFIAFHEPLPLLVQRDMAEMNVEIPKQQRLAQKVDLVRQLLVPIFGEQLHTERIYDDDLAPRLAAFNDLYDRLQVDVRFMRDNRDSKSPLARLRWVLSRLGLSFKRTRTTRDCHKINYYQLNAQELQNIAQIASVRLEGLMAEVQDGLWEQPRTTLGTTRERITRLYLQPIPAENITFTAIDSFAAESEMSGKTAISPPERGKLSNTRDLTGSTPPEKPLKTQK